jgi:thioredoxin-like negative regulator of GroEL
LIEKNEKSNGKWDLVKVNIDNFNQLAEEMKVKQLNMI